jgi:hypothetical protein
MDNTPHNKYRAALEILQKGRDQLVDQVTDQILDQGEDMLENGYLLQEFLENQGTRLHFLTLLASQIEQSAELLDEAHIEDEYPAAPEPARKRAARPRRRKTVEPAPENEPGET